MRPQTPDEQVLCRRATLRMLRAGDKLVTGQCKEGWQLRLVTSTLVTAMRDLTALGHGKEAMDILDSIRLEQAERNARRAA